MNTSEQRKNRDTVSFKNHSQVKVLVGGRRLHQTCRDTLGDMSPQQMTNHQQIIDDKSLLDSRSSEKLRGTLQRQIASCENLSRPQQVARIQPDLIRWQRFAQKYSRHTRRFIVMTCYRHVLLQLVAQRVPALIVSTLVLVGGPGKSFLGNLDI